MQDSKPQSVALVFCPAGKLRAEISRPYLALCCIVQLSVYRQEFKFPRQGIGKRFELRRIKMCIRDSPYRIRFEEGQRIVFGGRAYTVQSVDILYAKSAIPHRYEVGLA